MLQAIKNLALGAAVSMVGSPHKALPPKLPERSASAISTPDSFFATSEPLMFCLAPLPRFNIKDIAPLKPNAGYFKEYNNILAEMQHAKEGKFFVAFDQRDEPIEKTVTLTRPKDKDGKEIDGIRVVETQPHGTHIQRTTFIYNRASHSIEKFIETIELKTGKIDWHLRKKYTPHRKQGMLYEKFWFKRFNGPDVFEAGRERIGADGKTIDASKIPITLGEYLKNLDIK